MDKGRNKMDYESKLTPKYIVYLNKTYSNDEINKRYGYLYYIDSFCLGNKTYIVCNVWDGCHIGKRSCSRISW